MEYKLNLDYYNNVNKLITTDSTMASPVINKHNKEEVQKIQQT